MRRACPSGSVQWVACGRRQPDDHVAEALAGAAQEARARLTPLRASRCGRRFAHRRAVTS
jgi:hypothetical protein